MKKTSFFLLFLCLHLFCAAQTKPLLTRWAEQLDRSNPLPEYPRPQWVRNNLPTGQAGWQNLNGAWHYAILPKSTDEIPAKYDGDILVPFAVESYLSGVGKRVGKDSVLWYKRTISYQQIKNKKTILHFGAVDWLCKVFINGKEAGAHQGGYDPFSFDITPYLKKGKQQEIVVRVWDPSDDGPQPRGKQVNTPHGIWYTPVTGIWQTVWLETVFPTYIATARHAPDLDKQLFTTTPELIGALPGDEVIVSVWDGSVKITEQKAATGESITLPVVNPKTWSPDHPFLYDLKYVLKRKGRVIDEVTSYFAMRKISMQPDKNGLQRMLLNNEFVFQFGPLDQGWWPDGLYTPPGDEALRFDIEQTKAMGFNMIRKHVKTEPARWYYHCDQLGILVWQDMPSGDLGNKWEMRPGVYGKATDKDRSPESEAIFRNEWKEIVNDLYNFPCIVVWVPFNEAWGQFKTKEIATLTTEWDKTRLINAASGGNFEDAGQIVDLHNYPEPLMPDPVLFGKNKILVLGEYGGLGLPLEGHTWQQKNNWGYQSFKNETDLYNRYEEFINQLPHLIEKGLSAAVYTQTTDVEIETNGLMTYDRKVMKMPAEKLKTVHQKVYDKDLVKMK